MRALGQFQNIAVFVGIPQPLYLNRIVYKSLPRAVPELFFVKARIEQFHADFYRAQMRRFLFFLHNIDRVLEQFEGTLARQFFASAIFVRTVVGRIRIVDNVAVIFKVVGHF